MSGVLKPPCDEAVIRSTASSSPCAKNIGNWVLAATIIGTSIVFIDGAVVNVALPIIQKDLNANIASVQWIVEAYSLFLAALILVGGSLGDHFGRRRIFSIGIAVFGISSVVCGFAPNIAVLIFARAIQGIGGAMLVPGSLAIISASFPEETRGKAIGMWSGFSSIASGTGPVLGGWLIGHLSWRWAFFINVPLALVVLLILFARVPESHADLAEKGLDWSGALLATTGLGLVVYGLVESGSLGLGHPIVLSTVIVGILFLIGFVFNEIHSRHPMMPLGLFRSRSFAGANLLTLFLYAALSGMFFFLPFNLIQVQGYSTTEAAGAMIPFIVLMFGLSRWAGGLINRYGAKIPLIIGPVIASVGMALFALPSIGGSYWTTVFPAIVVLGLGMAISVAPLTTTVMTSVEDRYSGIASGINNAVSRTAGLLAIAVFSILMFQVYSASIKQGLNEVNVPAATKSAIDGQRSRLASTEIPADVKGADRETLKQVINESFISGYRWVMIAAAILALGGGAASLFLIEGKLKQPVAAGVEYNKRGR